MDEEKIDSDIAGLPACRGGVQADTPSDDLRQAVQVPEFQVDINLNRGEFSHTVYTTDLSPEYVDFNRSEYAYWNQAKADGLTRECYRSWPQAEGNAPSADVLAAVRRLLEEGARRVSRAQRFCMGTADCCRFRLTGETPHVTLGEAWLAWKAWRASGRTRVELPDDGSCPFLSGEGRSMIYEGRPLA